MKAGDFVRLKSHQQHSTWASESPGVIIKGPYGSAIYRDIGNHRVLEETLVVDVLVGVDIYEKVSTDHLKKA